MKVIREGVKPPPFVWMEYDWQCDECNTVAVFDEQDAKGIGSGWGASGLRIYCPVCGSQQNWRALGERGSYEARQKAADPQAYAERVLRRFFEGLDLKRAEIDTLDPPADMPLDAAEAWLLEPVTWDEFTSDKIAIDEAGAIRYLQLGILVRGILDAAEVTA